MFGPYIKSFLIFHGISDAWDKVVADAEKARLRHDFKEVPDFWMLPSPTFAQRECPHETKVVALYQSLSTLYQDQKKKSHHSDPAQVNQSGSDACPLCVECDSRVHFVLECEALQPTRDKYKVSFDQVKQNFPWMLWAPVVYKHPWHQAFMMLNAERDFPEAFRPFPVSRNVFFVDGSCIAPHIPAARLASFAVVQAMSCDESVCLDFVRGVILVILNRFK